MKNAAEETRTLYRGGQTEALVVQPVHGEPKFYLRGVGELTGDQRTQKLLGSNFTYYDLGLAFLHWPKVKLLDEGPGPGPRLLCDRGQGRRRAVPAREIVDRQGVLRPVAGGGI